MIKQLKRKFIALSMGALLILLAVVLTGMNIMNYASAVRQTDEILSLLAHNKGRFPEQGNDKGDRPLPPHMSPELPYEARYFTVLMDENGAVLQIDTSRIAAVDSAQAAEYAQRVWKKGEDWGFLLNYRYRVSEEGKGVRILFLDAGRTMDSLKTFLVSGILMAAVSYLLIFAVVVVVSGRIVRPIAESYAKQKRFITDAGHEIKTPLAIINANTDLLEMDIGEHESLEEVRNQTKRLTVLTNDLVQLAKMEEAEGKMTLTDLPLSETVEKAAAAFRASAQIQSKDYACEIAQGLHIKGNQKGIEQLVSILLDNAMKYSPEGGRILLSLEKGTRSARLAVYNTASYKIDREKTAHLFDRFYRMDDSRNSQSGGHGIGLSLALAIAKAHNAKILAETEDERSLIVTVIFPI